MWPQHGTWQLWQPQTKAFAQKLEGWKVSFTSLLIYQSIYQSIYFDNCTEGIESLKWLICLPVNLNGWGIELFLINLEKLKDCDMTHTLNVPEQFLLHIIIILFSLVTSSRVKRFLYRSRRSYLITLLLARGIFQLLVQISVWECIHFWNNSETWMPLNYCCWP